MLGAAGQSVAAAVAGGVLVHRSVPLFLVLAAAVLTATLAEVAIGLAMARLTTDWAARIRAVLCRSAFGQDLPTLEATPVGELLDRIDNDVHQVGSELRRGGVRLVQAVAVSALSVVTAFVVWWPAGVGMSALSVVLVLALRRTSRRIPPARMVEEEAWSDLIGVMEEAVHGQDDIRTTLARPYVLKLYATRASAVLRKGRAVWRLTAKVNGVATALLRIGVAAVVVVGVLALTTGQVDGARLTAIWLLCVGFGLTVDNVSRALPELQSALGAWGRVRQLREAEQEPSGGRPPAEGDLVVTGLTFRYPTTGQGPKPPAALADVDLVFREGASYALVGRTGSGKSTLVKALTRAVEVPRGTVFLGGIDLLDLDVGELRRWMAVVPQRTEILAGTLAENITLFDPDLLQSAARAVDELGLTEWVADLPDGLDTRLGDGGHVLSAGQEQLIAFARILVRAPHVVILDEATARMDPVTEARVRRATERLLRGRIGVIVAHRLSSVRHCDEVVVLADGKVLEAGPMARSAWITRLLPADVDHPAPAATAREDAADAVPAKSAPPPLPSPPRTRTMREILRLAVNDPRFGLSAVGVFVLLKLIGLDGPLLLQLWADLVDGSARTVVANAVAIVVALLLFPPGAYLTARRYPEWWTRQTLRIGLRMVHGQTGARRISAHSPAEVIAQSGDTDRVVFLADNLVDICIALVTLVTMTAISGTLVPALFFSGAMAVSALTATLFAPRMKRFAQRTVAARAALTTTLASALSAARTVKLAGATGAVLTHLDRLDRERNERLRREIAAQVWSRSTPSVVSGVSPLAVWALYLGGSLSSGATLIAVAALQSARWYAWVSASLVSQLPSARVWTDRTVAMTGSAAYSAAVPGVDLWTGSAPATPAATRHPLHTLELRGFSAVHEDGTIGVHEADLTVERGQLVLVIGPVGSGKSSLLRALAGIVHHTGGLLWNGRPITEPETFLRPNQVGYVAQLPRVLSGTLADNVGLGHDVDAANAISTAQLEHDLTKEGSGTALLIGHKGTRLSGGQLQRLALARALAPTTELLIADDVSSALDAATELELWRALRTKGVTVVGSTSKRAALDQADHVVVLINGKVVDQGKWPALSQTWLHLTG
ncbi:ATP-binding cassette domain-containing protein [Umezawaea endophytica]|uniref:ABC transporter ATP-binding protein/permease n=1 Tax=Umezawaea endophytica TaxID=1654476 RepID=A0A9X2VIQ6_9PSEU|nr:ABC transporter ATP-binding protein [Umezawaea endophytica]MCS7476812.1 ABC transporter ATP-binding protein/permease [Umezawaea endophytica]